VCTGPDQVNADGGCKFPGDMGVVGSKGFESWRRRGLLAKLGLVSLALALAPAGTGIAAPTRAAGGASAPHAPVAQRTVPIRPSATSGPADQITYQSARLRGVVDSGGQTTAYFFLFGTTQLYGSQSLTVSLVAGGSPVTVFGQIAGLLPLSVYHYKLVAINALGTTFGADQTFVTSAAPLSLTINASANPGFLGGPLSILGAIHGTGGAGSAVVLQANPFPFTGGFQIVGSPGLASAAGTFEFDLPSVPVTTEFRVVGVGSGQPLVSDTLTEFVQVAVTMTVTRGSRGGSGTALTISGLIRPAEVGARVSLQRLVGTRWMLVAATRSQPAAIESSSYAITLHPTHSGLYRVFATSVEGGHLANTSQAIVVHVHGPPGRVGSK
jgi:hypothetical protein